MAIITHMAPFPPGFKPEWRDHLEKHVALYRRMPEELTLCVEELVPWFLDRTKWQWADWKGGKMPNAEMAKVCVSFLACVLIVNRSKEDLAHFHTFVFHPDSLVDDRGTWGGWASPSGKIEQSWKSTLWGMEDGEDNRDVSIHEFAHMIDYRDKSFESVPHFDCTDAKKEYKAFLESEYKDICDAWEKGTGCQTIRKYATTDRAEFFTCSTDSFFGNSEMLQFLRPQLYKWMQRIYKMDPAQWRKRISAAELHDLRQTIWGNWSHNSRWRNRHGEVEAWPIGVVAKNYLKWADVKHGPEWREQRDRMAKEHQEYLWPEIKKALEQKERERKIILEVERKWERREKERARKEKERARKEKERHLLNNRTVVVDFPNGMPQLKYKLVDGLRDGLWQRWDEKQVLREEVEYAGGHKQGRVIYYHPNGEKELVGYHRKNEREGIWEGWHEDGTPSFRSEYREGKLHKWEQFSADGTSRTYGKVKNRFGR